jgi:ornithine carbamoyltransferase
MAADLMTMREHAPKPWHDISYCYLGDGRSNMGNSLLIAGCLMGMDVRIAAPRSLWPDEEHLDPARRLAEMYKARLTLTEDPLEGVRGVDFIHTDVWLSMGEPPEYWEQRIELLRGYQVNAGEIHARFGLEAMEVTDEVFESPAAIQFEQAENRVHSIKALLVATLGS